jgi:hypothetical protein
LTRKTTANHIDRKTFVWIKVPYVSPSLYMRPMLFKHRSSKWVNLHLPLALHPAGFEAQVETADARK